MLPRPLVAPVEGAILVSGQGPRHGRLHMGIDLTKGVRGDPVRCIGKGEVVFVDSSFPPFPDPCPQGNGYGNRVVIRHPDDELSLYAHLDTVAPLALGQRLAEGDILGTVGSTTGLPGDRWLTMSPHVHFELLREYPTGAQNVASRYDILAQLGAAGLVIDADGQLIPGEPRIVRTVRWEEVASKATRPAAAEDAGAIDIDTLQRCLWACASPLEAAGRRYSILRPFVAEIQDSCRATWGDDWRELAEQTDRGRYRWRVRVTELEPAQLAIWSGRVAALRRFVADAYAAGLAADLARSEATLDMMRDLYCLDFATVAFWRAAQAVVTDILRAASRAAGDAAEDIARFGGRMVSAVAEGAGLGRLLLAALAVAAGSLLLR